MDYGCNKIAVFQWYVEWAVVIGRLNDGKERLGLLFSTSLDSRNRFLSDMPHTLILGDR